MKKRFAQLARVLLVGAVICVPSVIAGADGAGAASTLCIHASSFTAIVGNNYMDTQVPLNAFYPQVEWVYSNSTTFDQFQTGTASTWPSGGVTIGEAQVRRSGSATGSGAGNV